MLPETTLRVQKHTAKQVNEKIRRQILCNIRYFEGAGPEAINKRLGELEREWDIERVLNVNASVVGLLGVGLGATVNRKFFILPAIAGAFLMLHALEGWCPPVPVLRRIGIRTMSEIYFEKFALKALRGDFRNVPSRDGEQKLEEAVAAVQK